MPNMSSTQTAKIKTAQDIQDEVFQKMSAEQKVKIVSNFFKLARKLNPAYFNYGARKLTDNNSRNP